MNPSRLIRAAINAITGQQISTASLQFRLTLELVGISILGLGSVAFWASWHMEQHLIAANKQTLNYIALHFPDQVAFYSEDTSVQTGLEQTINKVSTPKLFVWVNSPEGQPIAQSPQMRIPPTELSYLASIVEMPAKPKVINFGDRYWVLCGSPLTIGGMPIGRVYFSQDITQEHRKLIEGRSQLILVSLFTILMLALSMQGRIRYALQPLEQMSRVASAVSADDLSGAKLQLQQAPDEILGLAQSFNEMLFRLSSSWEQQRQFVGNVSHELRTPLTVVMGYLQSLLRRSTNLSPYQQQALETASAETERTIRMLQDLLDLARADSGNLHFRLNPVILNTLVAEVA